VLGEYQRDPGDLADPEDDDVPEEAVEVLADAVDGLALEGAEGDLDGAEDDLVEELEGVEDDLETFAGELDDLVDDLEDDLDLENVAVQGLPCAWGIHELAVVFEDVGHV
jgi:hypothetical protein